MFSPVAADALISESDLFHIFRPIHIAQIDHDQLRHLRLQPRKVEDLKIEEVVHRHASLGLNPLPMANSAARGGILISLAC